MSNFVPAETHTTAERNNLPVVSTMPDVSMLTRQDVVSAYHDLLQAYQNQQDEVLDGWMPITKHNPINQSSTTSHTPLYLASTIVLAAITVGGIALVSVQAGAHVGWALAGWMAGTGCLSILMVRHQHNAELRHTPMGLAHSALDSMHDLLVNSQQIHADLLAAEREDARSVATARAAAAAEQRQLARDLAISKQKRSVPVDVPTMPSVPVDVPSVPVDVPSVPSVPVDVPSVPSVPVDVPSVPVDAAVALLQWAAQLFDNDNITTDGIVLCRVPWSARTDWPAEYAAYARRICLEQRPPLFAQTAGKRWQLRMQLVSTSSQLLQVLEQRL
jgi:hypothetical protein